MSAPARRRTRAEQRAETRQALLDAAARVFIARGFVGASVEAIAEEAGYTRGAFYSNFESKEQLFAELLQQRVYAMYKSMATEAAAGARPSLRESGERLAQIQADEEGRWLFRLWLELLAHAGRDGDFRTIAAQFWSGNRALTAKAIEDSYHEAGAEPPAPAADLATAMIALDIGLALQHFVDPDAVPLRVYPELYELLFGAIGPDGPGS